MNRDDELRALCLACGACCDGTMFEHVALDGDGDLERAKKRSLPLIHAGKTARIAQPCVAYQASCCAIYEDRPSRCATYQCALYVDHANNGGDLEERLRRVRGLKAIAARIASSDSSSVSPLDKAELLMRLKRDFGWARGR